MMMKSFCPLRNLQIQLLSVVGRSNGSDFGGVTKWTKRRDDRIESEGISRKNKRVPSSHRRRNFYTRETVVESKYFIIVRIFEEREKERERFSSCWDSCWVKKVLFEKFYSSIPLVGMKQFLSKCVFSR